MSVDNSSLSLVAVLEDSSNAGSKQFSSHKVHQISHLICFSYQELSVLVGEWLIVVTVEEMMGKYLYHQKRRQGFLFT